MTIELQLNKMENFSSLCLFWTLAEIPIQTKDQFSHSEATFDPNSELMKHIIVRVLHSVRIKSAVK